ncbi:hypothetical protein ACFWHW_13230 [Streptomyces pharetrae]|uniref:hypothetical protein n=1 Tax=Streptomyces pharetrae TaxID=291370 RepID=UPI00364EAB69
MQTEILVGLIGFGGAVVGAGGALVGAWLQQHHQSKTAQAQRIEDRARDAGNNALAELLVLRRLVTENVHSNLDEEMPGWRSVAQRHMDATEMALLLMPQAKEVQARVIGALRLAERALAFAARADLGLHVEKLHLYNCSNEAIQVLAAFMRGDPLPKPSRWIQSIEEDLERQPHASL